MTDPTGQFKWMQQQLQSAKGNKEKVTLTLKIYGTSIYDGTDLLIFQLAAVLDRPLFIVDIHCMPLL